MLRPQVLRDDPAIASSGSIRLPGRTSPVCTVYTVRPWYPPAHGGSTVEDLRHLNAAGDRHVEAGTELQLAETTSSPAATDFHCGTSSPSVRICIWAKLAGTVAHFVGAAQRRSQAST